MRYCNLIIGVISLSVCLSPVNAQTENQNYIGVWTNESRTEVEAWPSISNPFFDVFVYLLPGPDGAFAVEYKLGGPEEYMPVSIVPGSLVSVWLGDVYGGGGVSVTFIRCQYEPFLIFYLMMYSDSFFECSCIQFYPHEETQLMSVAICPYPRPKVEANPISFVRVNCPYASKESSWGAIKGVYRTGND